MPRDATATRRCLVLAEAGERPGPLLIALHRQHIDTRVAERPVDVMVELAQRPTHLLIMHGPRDIDSSARLIAAVRRYHPKVVCGAFRCDETGKGCLISLGDAADVADALRAAWRVDDDVRGADGLPAGTRALTENTDAQADSGIREEDVAREARPDAPSATDWKAWERHDDDAPPATPSALLSPEEIEVLIGPRPGGY